MWQKVPFLSGSEGQFLRDCFNQKQCFQVSLPRGGNLETLKNRIKEKEKQMKYIKETAKQPKALALITAAMATPWGIGIAAAGLVGVTLYNVRKKRTVKSGSETALPEQEATVETAYETVDSTAEETVQTANKPLSEEYTEEEKRLIISEAMSMLGKKSGAARRRKAD